MSWLTYLALGLSFLAVFSSVWCFLRLSEKLEKSDIRPALENASNEITSEITRKIKAIEVDWDNMYLKFSKLAGRMDRERALIAGDSEPAAPAAPTTRAEIYRKWRNK